MSQRQLPVSTSCMQQFFKAGSRTRIAPLRCQHTTISSGWLQSEKLVVRLRAFSAVTRMAYENVLKNPDDFDFEIQQPETPATSATSVKTRRNYFLKPNQNLTHQLKECKQLQRSRKRELEKKSAIHTTRAAIITCGGLCPGLNNVIKGKSMS